MPAIDERWAQVWRRLLGISGGKPINALEDVFPTVNLYEEHAHLFAMRGERLFQCAHTVAAGGAGQYGVVELHNPVNSEHIIVVDQLIFSGQGGNLVYMGNRVGPNTVYGTAGGQKTHLDGAYWNKGDPLLLVQVLTSAVAPSFATSYDNIFAGQLGTAWVNPWPQRLVFHPGDNTNFKFAAANSQLYVQVRGYEVPMHGGERS